MDVINEREFLKDALKGFLDSSNASDWGFVRESATDRLIAAIDQYVEMKMAETMDMMSDRIESSTGVRP